MYLQAVVWTVLAWFAGLILDANLSIQPAGFLCLRVLLPMLSMGLCILREIRRNGQKLISAKRPQRFLCGRFLCANFCKIGGTARTHHA